MLRSLFKDLLEAGGGALIRMKQDNSKINIIFRKIKRKDWVITFDSVIFCYWVGPVPYLELFGAGPVEKNTLYIGIAFSMDML